MAALTELIAHGGIAGAIAEASFLVAVGGVFGAVWLRERRARKDRAPAKLKDGEEG